MGWGVEILGVVVVIVCMIGEIEMSSNLRLKV